MITRTTGMREAQVTAKRVACAALALVITLSTMLTIANTAATRLFVMQPTVAAPSAIATSATTMVAAR